MSMDSSLYPHNWKAIAAELKEAAQWRCQRCRKKAGEWTYNRYGQRRRVVLSVAHLDHDPYNPHARLLVLCLACHLRYDASHAERGRKRRNMSIARGQLTLWEMEA
jgi:hypothetical protein